MNHLFLHCRAGFEKECSAEITDMAAEFGIFGYCKTKDASGYVIFISHDADGAGSLIKKIHFNKLIFVRQWFAGNGLMLGAVQNEFFNLLYRMVVGCFQSSN